MQIFKLNEAQVWGEALSSLSDVIGKQRAVQFSNGKIETQVQIQVFIVGLLRFLRLLALERFSRYTFAITTFSTLAF